MKISLQASSYSSNTGDLCREGAIGLLHSVFNHALNILVRQELFSVLAIEKAEFPNSILVNPSLIEGFTNLSLTTNLITKFDKEYVIIGEKLLIYLKESTTYSDKKEVSSDILDKIYLQNNIDMAVAAGIRIANKEGLGIFWKSIQRILMDIPSETDGFSIFQKKAYLRICDLVHGLRHRNLDLVKKAVSDLSGFGIGLTPSGDDFLTGLISAFNLFGSKTVQGQYFSEIVEVILDYSRGNTNLISFQQLLSASRFEITSGLANYISAIVSGGTNKTQSLIEENSQLLFLYGHSSGTEMGLGAVVGISLINEARASLTV